MTHSRRLRSGITLVEVLAATLVVSIAVAGAVSLFSSMLNITRNTRDRSTAAQLAKIVTERVRMEGFTNVVDGTAVRYYNVSGTLSSESSTQSTSSYYSATTVVSTDKTQTSTTGSRIAPLALRTVTVTVRRLSDNSVLDTWGTILARGGV